ncbi:F-box/kelch-repeat protein At3g06240-like isoform X2 [Cornus florida]|uniref:F-box/kelch-repeat protein At3g06240-like isoform X2 n=1 Tax=Cornus florida TaxID=4283 RepID=UPI0028974169|nr:F-box/kelch-repeat protein At3g06240-like isoform X2 [Cornus florida]
MSSNGAELPQELLIDILSRLPAKSLCRFKCVSKPWLTLISDPHFAQTHLNRNKPQRVILLSDYLYSVDCDETSDSASVMATKLDFPPIDYPNELIDILGSWNGLILIANEENAKFLLNPTTRESKKLPKSPFALDPFSSYTMYGLGYDSSTDDYKVLSVAYNARDEDDDDEEEKECADTFVSVFSLKTGAWRRIQDVPYDHSSLEPYSLVLVNGSIHWLTCRSSDYSSVIAAFDVAEEKFRDVPAPSSIDNNRLVLHGLGVFGEFLCVLVCCNSNKTDVWAMKEYGVTESWTKFTTICKPYMHMMEPLCFLVDEEVLLEMDGKKLVAFNAKERTSRDIVVRGIPRTFRAGKTYVESLVSPCCNSGIERKFKGSRNLKNCQLNRTRTEQLVAEAKRNDLASSSSSRSIEASNFITDHFSQSDFLDFLKSTGILERPIYEKALKMFQDPYWREKFISMLDEGKRF